MSDAVERVMQWLSLSARYPVRPHVRVQGGHVVQVSGYLRRHGPFPSFVRGEQKHTLLTVHKVPPAALDSLTKMHVRLAVGDDPTIPTSIFGMKGGTYRPAMRQVTVWAHPKSRTGWVHGVIAHEVGHALALDEIYNATGSRGAAEAHTEEMAWELGRRWAEQVGLQMDHDFDMIEDVAVTILHQEM